MSNAVISAIGFSGAFLSLFAYFQVSHDKWRGKSKSFQISNALAAILLIIYGLQVKGYANIFLNAI